MRGLERREFFEIPSNWHQILTEKKHMAHTHAQNMQMNCEKKKINELHRRLSHLPISRQPHLLQTSERARTRKKMYETKKKIINNFIYKYLVELKSKRQAVPYTIRHSYQISNSNRNNM